MLEICGHRIGTDAPPFVIAEMSGNHNQSLERALEIVEAAAAAGAHALKIQTYTADTMTIDVREGEFFIADPNSLWKGNSLYELYQQAHTPYEWQTVASRSTYCAGNATKLAAEDIRNKILELAQIKMGTWKNDLYLEGGFVCRKFYPDQKVPLAAFALGLTLPDQSGTAHTLTQYRGKWLVLYFYPKDDTPGCTEQA